MAVADKYNLVPPAIKARLESEEAIDRQLDTRDWLNEALRAKDPYLSVVFIKPNIPEWDLPVGAKAGYWHVKRNNPDFVPTYMPIQGPKGEFREPTSNVLQMVDENDLHKDEVWRDVISRRERQEREKAKAGALEDEQRRDELTDDLKAGWRVRGEGGLQKSFEAKRRGKGLKK